MSSSKPSWWRQLRGLTAADEMADTVATDQALESGASAVPAKGEAGTAPGNGATGRPLGAGETPEQRFAQNSSENLFRGVFNSADEATRSAPPTRPLGYDNPESAALYFGRMRHELYDYPAMFWLRRALDDGLRTIFDVGGHVGIKFYAFREPLRLPDDVRWLVCDVPAVIDRGAKVAARRGVDKWLSFTSDYERLDGLDILFASGALQYLPHTLDEWLGRLRQLPKRLVINTTAVHPSLDFYTLNSIGTAFCPYHVVAEQRFLDGVGAHGYELIDRWINPGKTLRLDGHAEHGLDHYSGFCFQRRETGGSAA